MRLPLLPDHPRQHQQRHRRQEGPQRVVVHQAGGEEKARREGDRHRRPRRHPFLLREQPPCQRVRPPDRPGAENDGEQAGQVNRQRRPPVREPLRVGVDVVVLVVPMSDGQKGRVWILPRVERGQVLLRHPERQGGGQQVVEGRLARLLPGQVRVLVRRLAGQPLPLRDVPDVGIVPGLVVPLKEGDDEAVERSQKREREK